VEPQEYWVARAKLIERPVGETGERLSDRQLLQQRELVKVTIENDLTTVKWVMFAANWSSLYFVVSWLKTIKTPIKLCFFNAGWFEEFFDIGHDAINRMEDLIPKSDVRFSNRTYTRNFNPSHEKLPEMLGQIWQSGAIDSSHAVLCAIDTERKLTQVEYVGSDSALAKVWGISPVSYPCLSGHSYDRIVSETYYEVVRTGRPVYDHVLAAMTHPGGDVRWFNYHRLVFPSKMKSSNFQLVAVACEVAKVNIPIL
jgi:hypothetical protein